MSLFATSKRPWHATACVLLITVAGVMYLTYSIERIKELTILRHGGQPKSFTKLTPEENDAYVYEHPFKWNGSLEIDSAYRLPSFEYLLHHGHLLTASSGGNMARWTFTTARREYRLPLDCHLLWNATQIQQDNQTIYVSHLQIPTFVDYLLPGLQHAFVLISGMHELARKKISDSYYRQILENPHLIKWFFQQRDFHINSTNAYYAQHPKLTSFPYGLDRGRTITYKQELLKLFAVRKTKQIFVSHLTKENNIQLRQDIPQGPWLEYPAYLKRMSQAHYTLAPNGDRPECFRHYEALGLGTVPVTQWLSNSVPHLSHAGVIFWGNKKGKWTLQMLKRELPKPPPPVERRVVFQEYWTAYVNRLVEIDLCWWDASEQRPSRVCSS